MGMSVRDRDLSVKVEPLSKFSRYMVNVHVCISGTVFIAHPHYDVIHAC